MGYEYVRNANNEVSGISGGPLGGMFMYDYASATWLHTSADASFPFPYIYDFGLNAVFYYFPDPNHPGRYNTDGVRHCYNFATGQIISK